MSNKISTGILGLDNVIDYLRLGDNVVWQIDTINDYQQMLIPYVRKALDENRKIIYIRFGKHQNLLDNVTKYELDPSNGFEIFATELNKIIQLEGFKVFYVFDCLSELLRFWYSDLMIGNFFYTTCPLLYELDTIAYFAIIRNGHTYDTIAKIRETTQVLLDLYYINNNCYIHPLKVWKRYSPTMYLPHLINDENATCITASADIASLFSQYKWDTKYIDYWEEIFLKAVSKPIEYKTLLVNILLGKSPRMHELCLKYFTVEDLIKIKQRQIGTGYIGGKSVGMLLARKIIYTKDLNLYHKFEEHDSYYIGTDVFYSFIVENGLWNLLMKQKTKEGYFQYANMLKEKMLQGSFSLKITEQFYMMLTYFGQSPIIVRSSSLLEDNFGNAFAGKYESIFCANQGTLEDRYKSFIEAVKIVYASTMNHDALAYRMNRGLFALDEQMAILVQRVSGDYHQNYFYPHIGGVGNSKNLYVWDKDIDLDYGMLRIVVGLGTRAVDRISGDYSQIITLDNPLRKLKISLADKKKFSQHKMDVINVKDNLLEALNIDDKFDKDYYDLVASVDEFMQNEYIQRGINYSNLPKIIDFSKMINETDIPNEMQKILKILEEAYAYPIDIEYTINFKKNNQYMINLLQARPLQTKGIGKAMTIPKQNAQCILYTKNNFMGGNVRIPVKHLVYIKAKEYLKLSEQDKYNIARYIGIINEELKNKDSIIIAPGRFGTTTPSLGIPIHFSEICHFKSLCEVSIENMNPELSFGSHFFQDLVESDIFYIAIFSENQETIFNEKKILKEENIYNDSKYSHIVHVIKLNCEIISNIISQEVIIQ